MKALLQPLMLTAVIGAALVSLSTYAGDNKTVNRSVAVAAATSNDDVSSVNGSVRLAAGASAKDVSSVNGSVTLSTDNRVKNLSTVNGGIRVERGLRASGDVKSVNGDLALGIDAQVSGEINTVNGDLTQDSGSIGQEIRTVNGDIELGTVTVQGPITTVWGDVVLNGAAALAGIRVQKPRGINWGKTPEPPRVVLGAGARVSGSIVLEHPTRVYVHQDAALPEVTGEIVGGAIVRFAGTQAPRN
jgi:cytoskeletal protein CcmA (bactofilin family)